MTDRIKGLYVAFESDIREDDVEPLVNAIRMLRGVLAVKLQVADSSDWIARQRVRREISDQLWDVLHPKEKP